MKAWFVHKTTGRVVEVVKEDNKYIDFKYFPSGAKSMLTVAKFEATFIELPTE